MSIDNFEDWLSEELKNLNTDEEVFRPYIKSILEDEDGNEEESLDEILSDIIQQEQTRNDFKSSILKKWKESAGGRGQSEKNGDSTDKNSSDSGVDLNSALKSITESQTQAYAASRSAAAGSRNGIGLPEPDKGLKAAIIAQYSHAVEEDEEDEDEDDSGGGATGGGGDILPANTNSIDVAQAQLEQREKSKALAAAKKEKDKEDREKQKKQQEDRKKKAQEKASKGERRR